MAAGLQWKLEMRGKRYITESNAQSFPSSLWTGAQVKTDISCIKFVLSRHEIWNTGSAFLSSRLCDISSQYNAGGHGMSR